ncbi:MAG TPA: hypothetical protein VHQ66_14450 [Myxococcota bacterium]|nr:hypothetical protein [Myxococcota bacterium]
MPALLAAQLTLVSLLLGPVGVYEVRAGVLLLATAGLLATRLATSAGLWLALAALAALRVALDWPLSDNHAYLLAYWCLTLGLAFAAGAPEDPGAAARLALTARLLVGVVFALATAQKLLAPDYTDGTFFRYSLAVDGRFESLGVLLGRGHEELERTRAFLDAAPWGPPPPGAAFEETSALRAAAGLLTAATLVLEGAVALAFLLPAGWLPAALRDGVLLAFCAGTYAVAPVAGFGWLLLAMGVAQADAGRARTRALYLAAFALILLFRELPWLDLFAARAPHG